MDKKKKVGSKTIYLDEEVYEEFGKLYGRDRPRRIRMAMKEYLERNKR